MGKLPFGSAGLISKLFGSKKSASPSFPFLKKAGDAGTGTWPATLNSEKIPGIEEQTMMTAKENEEEQLKKEFEFYCKVPRGVDASATESKITKLISELCILSSDISKKEAKEKKEGNER